MSVTKVNEVDWKWRKKLSGTLLDLNYSGKDPPSVRFQESPVDRNPSRAFKDGP